MKKFLLRILVLFVIPLCAIIGLQEYALRQVPNDYAYKNDWLTKNAQHVHVLTLGSSHGLYGFQPKEFSKAAFNAGHVSQSLKYDKFILEKFIEMMDSLEYVILPVSYFSVRSSGLEDGDEWWRVKNYTIYYKCPYHRYEPKYALECYQFAPKGTLKALLGETNHLDVDSLGRGLAYSYENKDKEHWSKNGAQRAKYHTKKHDDDLVQQNVNYISSIIELCRNKGVNLILITTPNFYTYRDNLDQDQVNEIVQICSDFAIQNSNVEYLNWMAHEDFVGDDFFDSDHLCDLGAIKLSRLLDSCLFTK